MTSVSLAELNEQLDRLGCDNPIANAHLIALLVVGRMMGPNWFAHRFCEFGKKNLAGMYFLPSPDVDDQHVVWRQIRFAELLFNLQKLDGFCDHAKQWTGSAPEAIVAELEGAFYMMACGHRASFTTSSAQPEHDFDVTLLWGKQCTWEAKAKLETGEFNLKKLSNVFKKTRKQSTKDLPNILFVRIPEQWTLQGDYEDKLESAADYFFRNSHDRAISLLFHWELWNTDRHRPNNFGLSGLEFVNLRWEILMSGRRVMKSYRGFPRDWVRFDELCVNHLRHRSGKAICP